MNLLQYNPILWISNLFILFAASFVLLGVYSKENQENGFTYEKAVLFGYELGLMFMGLVILL